MPTVQHWKIENKLAQRERELAERARATESGRPSDQDLASNDSSKQNVDSSQMSALTNLLIELFFSSGLISAERKKTV
ncbi:hypothetical protein E2C01_060615 [Portunus trituberculatus]|uniref:Uncharacterized protein n=1 Tax=Portunus trituberculatus TaxID=210409 RepID=A0A5B7HAZ3_PORTR|nr:hypothetical protein [Portunus trituberculatus]